jgi:DNA-binding GntR family transcriptional regulator
MPNLKSLSQPASLSKLAYDAILKSILSNTMIPNEVYNEIALAKDLGISRTPVREALLELSVQGLVTFLPRKGIVINRFTAKDVDEIFEIRRAIESAAVEKIASADPPPNTGLLQKTIEKQNKAIQKKDFWMYMQADRDFHVCLSQLTGNNRLVAISKNIRNMIHLMGTKALELPGRAKEVLFEHEHILKAIQECRPLEAREAIIDHLIKSEQAVLATLNDSRPARLKKKEGKAGK